MPAISPRTQAMGNTGVSGDQAKVMFEQGLSEMAYNVLINKLPNVAPDVVTFKILESKPEVGSGVGAFVIARQGQTLYVPVVMAENQIKPLDILYYKDLNIFVPLTKEWLQELDKLSLGDLGSGAKMPNTMSTDVDIRNTVIPPTTGRYSYASTETMFEEAKKQSGPKLAFLSFIENAPNRVKKAAAKLFETNPKLLKIAVSHYGTTPLLNSLKLAQEKVADYGGKLSRSGGLYIADKSTKSKEFKDIFGDKAPLAFSGVSLKGYYSKDDRKDVKRALRIERFIDYQEPMEVGVYRLHQADGSPLLAIIFPNARDLFRDDFKSNGRRISNSSSRYDRMSGPSFYHSKTTSDKNDVHLENWHTYIGIVEDGSLLSTSKLLGEHVPDGEASKSTSLNKVFSETTKTPKVGQTGLFVNINGSRMLATKPMKIESITSDSAGVRRIKVTDGMRVKILVTDPSNSMNQITSPSNSQITYVPDTYSFIPLKGTFDTSKLLSDPRDYIMRAQNELEKLGAVKVAVTHSIGMGWRVLVNNEKTAQSDDFVDSLRKLALSSGISVDDSEYVLRKAIDEGRYEFWATSDKQAAVDDGTPKKKDPSTGGANDQAGDPAQQAMDGVMGAQMAPQAPAPIDMAVAESMQNLMMQQQGLQQQMSLLQQIQMRTNQIAGGGGAMGNPAAAAAAMGGPMDPSMMGAGAATQPQQQGQPSQMSGQPMSGQPQQSAGQMSGQPQMGMAAQPQGQMPGQQMGGQSQGQQDQQPPGATMTADDGSPEHLLQQVNPQFLEQAGALQNAGIFDAATLGSMAQAPALKDMVAAYLPNLEKSLDNVGRVLLTLWMDESSIKGDIGNETFIELEDNLRTTFKGLGELILRINQNSLILRGPYEQENKDI